MKNKDIIRKLAWSFHKSTGIDYRELFAEACLGYYEALRSYDATKGCLVSTWTWKVIQNQLIDYVKREKCIPYPISPIAIFGNRLRNHERNVGASADKIEAFVISNGKQAEQLPETLLVQQPTSFEEWVADLPEECKQIARVIVANVDAIPEDIPPKMKRGVVVKLLRDEGYSFPFILKGMKGLRLAVTGYGYTKPTVRL